MITYNQVKKALKIINSYVLEQELNSIEAKAKYLFPNATPESKLCEVGLSTKPLRVLKACDHLGYKYDENTTVKALDGLSKRHLLELRQMGTKSIEEIEVLCYAAGIQLKP